MRQQSLVYDNHNVSQSISGKRNERINLPCLIFYFLKKITPKRIRRKSNSKYCLCKRHYLMLSTAWYIDMYKNLVQQRQRAWNKHESYLYKSVHHTIKIFCTWRMVFVVLCCAVLTNLKVRLHKMKAKVNVLTSILLFDSFRLKATLTFATFDVR